MEKLSMIDENFQTQLSVPNENQSKMEQKKSGA